MVKTQKDENIFIIGKMKLESGNLIVTDPCYEKTECSQFQNIIPAKVGEWNIMIEKYEDEVVGERVAGLWAVHKDFPFFENSMKDWEKLPNDNAVDSGQLGIFDEKYFRDDNDTALKKVNPSKVCKDERFYSRMCNLTLNTKHKAGVYKHGGVCSSGMGDGVYYAYRLVDKSDNKAFAVMIQFIDTEETEDEEDNDDEETDYTIYD